MPTLVFKCPFCSLFTSIADNRLMTVFYFAVFSHLVVPLIEYLKVLKTFFLRDNLGLMDLKERSESYVIVCDQ